MTDCSKYEEILALYYDGLLDEKEHEALLKHLEDCSECAQRLEDYRIMLHEMENLRVDPPKNLHAHIMDAVRKQKAPARFWGGFGPFTIAAAIVVVILFSLNSIFDLSHMYLFGRDTAASETVQSGDVADSAPGGSDGADGSNEMALQGDGDSGGVSKSSGAEELTEAPLDAPADSSTADGVSPMAGAAGGSRVDVSEYQAAGNAGLSAPDTLPLGGEYRDVIVAEGGAEKLRALVNNVRETEIDGVTYFVLPEDGDALNTVIRTLSEGGFALSRYTTGKDYINSSSSQMLVIVRN